LGTLLRPLTREQRDTKKKTPLNAMPETFYDEVDIEDFTWDDKLGIYHYPCPCGDRFEITKSQLRDGDDVARCPSCSLIIRVQYEWVSG